MRHSENNEQSMVVRYLSVRVPGALFTSSVSGVKVKLPTMIALKRAGYKKGTPDLMIFEPRHGFHGLFIEMKTGKTAYSEKGKTTPEQKQWQQDLIDRGYSAHICYGFEEAKEVIDNYFFGNPRPHGV